MSDGIVKKKVDKQGRIVLPADWRENELSENKEVFIIQEKGYLKIIPKKDFDLTKFFDIANLGKNVEDWDQFEENLYTK